MAYKEGSLGLAILLGLIVFFALNSTLAMAISGVNVYSAISGIVLGGFGFITSCLIGFCIANTTALILAIIVPIITGILAGIIARGSAGRGFIAGLASALIAYYVAFVVYVIYVYAISGSLSFVGGIGTTNADMLVPLLSSLLIIPILAGILSGLSGGFMSAILAVPAPASSLQTGPAIATTVVQAQPYPQMVIQAPQQQPVASSPARVICPACKEENDSSSTFCQSCGTRLKS